CLAFSPTGNLLAGANAADRGRRSGSVTLWNPRTGAQQGLLETGTEKVDALAFSPNGALLATGSEDGTIRLWNPMAEIPAGILTGHVGPVRAVAFSPRGRRLASAGEDGIRL